MSYRSAARPYICDSCLGRLCFLRRIPLSPRRHISTSTARTALVASRCPPNLYESPQQEFERSSSKTSIPRSDPRRLYSTQQTPNRLPDLATAGFAPLPDRRLISLSGPDAAKFLQGLVTNNVDSNRRTPFYSAFLDARGRVLWDVFVWVYPELAANDWACYIEVDGGEAEALAKHLKRHKLRSKISMKLVEENEVRVAAAWGLPSAELQHAAIIASLEDPRALNFGFRCLYKEENGLPEAATSLTVPVVDTIQYHMRRYLHGIAEGPKEIPRESALPMECNIDLSNGIDFKKGCYVGQELTIRTKHTGVVRKRMLPVQLYLEQADIGKATLPDLDPTWNHKPIKSGADIKPLDEEGNVKKGRAAGKFIAGIGNVGLALCRLEMMTSMRVSAEGGSWKPNAEFGVQREEADGVEKPVKIKAIAHQWFQERERDMWDKGRNRV
ncbi:hypothetical protein BDV95DRAFT_567559 [Massariosphaeria phaeospora]|uniref:Iron-sulfur cluster assembly factor IBA57 homolog, mitochondrial n=1 Tax=Massariosphaeria phaeospora TaxID=100035 RepID=A0A7C8IDP4_9PLEO|nr:hypothetical protein BDV95DRAFT_567559 [Massariosphaeria phaeospora]